MIPDKTVLGIVAQSQEIPVIQTESKLGGSDSPIWE